MGLTRLREGVVKVEKTIEWRKGKMKFGKNILICFSLRSCISNKDIREIFIFFRKGQEQKRLRKATLKIFSSTRPIVFTELVQGARLKKSRLSVMHFTEMTFILR